MKIFFVSIVIIFTGISKLHAQDTSTKIEILKAFPVYKFKQHNLSLSIREIALILKNNELAYKLIRPAKVSSAIANSVWTMGSLMIIVPLGEIIMDSNSRYFWTFASIGASLMAVSIPLIGKADKQAKHAIELYNSGLSSNLYKQHKPEFYLISNNNGLGLIMIF